MKIEVFAFADYKFVFIFLDFRQEVNHAQLISEKRTGK